MQERMGQRASAIETSHVDAPATVPTVGKSTLVDQQAVHATSPRAQKPTFTGAQIPWSNGTQHAGPNETSGGSEAEVGQSNRSGLRANTLLDIWESNIQIARNNFEPFVKAKAPPRALAIAKAIGSIGVEGGAARLFAGPIAAAAYEELKFVLALGQATYKQGMNALIKELVGNGDGLRMSPIEFAGRWQSQLLRAINDARATVVDSLNPDGVMPENERHARITALKAAAPTETAMTQLLLQQYTHACITRAETRAIPLTASSTS